MVKTPIKIKYYKDSEGFHYKKLRGNWYRKIGNKWFKIDKKQKTAISYLNKNTDPIWGTKLQLTQTRKLIRRKR